MFIHYLLEEALQLKLFVCEPSLLDAKMEAFNADETDLITTEYKVMKLSI